MKQAEAPGSNLVMIVTERLVCFRILELFMRAAVINSNCVCRGGHLGFLEGHLPFKKPFHYMERVVLEFVRGVRLHLDDLKI